MKSKTNIINKSLEKDECISFLSRQGYNIKKNEKDTIVLKKPGTTWTFCGKNMPLELTIFFQEDGTTLSLKYDALALFDTGDLQEILLEISSGLTQNEIN